MTEAPSDLIPLGSIHNERRRGALMAVVDREWHKGALSLWGFEGWRGAEHKPVPLGYELNWVGGPSREEGHPNFFSLTYFCDVTAELREPTSKNLPWTEIRISEKTL